MLKRYQPRSENSPRSHQRGIALLMVVFMITLASALLISLTDSTYVAMRLNSAAEQRIKAEYLLKSAVGVAQIMIKNDQTPFDNPGMDVWMSFAEGREVPGELLALPEPNIRVTLMVASKTGKIPIAKVWQAGNPSDTTWRDIVTSLFRLLGFDLPDPSNTNNSNEPPANSQQMVANLIDYLDSDQTNYSQNNFESGVEADLPDGAQFRNEGVIDSLASELASIPGFTPGRVQKILPFVYVSSKDVRQVNVNAAPYEVLAAMTDPAAAQQIATCRQPTPDLKGGIQSVADLQTCGVDPTFTQGGNFSVAGTLFEVIAKVEYGTSAFMASAELSGSGAGKLPVVTSFQVY